MPKRPPAASRSRQACSADQRVREEERHERAQARSYVRRRRGPGPRRRPRSRSTLAKPRASTSPRVVRTISLEMSNPVTWPTGSDCLGQREERRATAAPDVQRSLAGLGRELADQPVRDRGEPVDTDGVVRRRHAVEHRSDPKSLLMNIIAPVCRASTSHLASCHDRSVREDACVRNGPYADRREAGPVLAADERLAGTPAAMWSCSACLEAAYPSLLQSRTRCTRRSTSSSYASWARPGTPSWRWARSPASAGRSRWSATNGWRLASPTPTSSRSISASWSSCANARPATARDGRPVVVRGRVAILVDDGLATGSTMRAAIAAVRTQQPERVVVAVPVGAGRCLPRARRGGRRGRVRLGSAGVPRGRAGVRRLRPDHRRRGPRRARDPP